MNELLSRDNPMILKAILMGLGVLSVGLAQAGIISMGPVKTTADQMERLTNVAQTGMPVESITLPSPYKYLLMQPLMTSGIEAYYGRTALIKTVYAIKNQHDNTYSRASIMYLDRNKTRNNVNEAWAKNEAFTVELAFITINFAELPKPLIAEVLNTNIPFGKLLTRHKIRISTDDRNYFEVACNEELMALLSCKANSKVYGRTNTIIHADTKKWLAHVVEVLSGARP